MGGETMEMSYRRLPHVERELAGDRRLVQVVGSDRAVQLAGSAPMIWDLLDDHREPAQIVAQLQQHFSDAPEVIAAGVEAGLRSLVASSLIEAQ